MFFSSDGKLMWFLWSPNGVFTHNPKRPLEKPEVSENRNRVLWSVR